MALLTPPGFLHSLRLPGESVDYRNARDLLLREEADLRERIERVAALRRRLPRGGPMPKDYAFTEWDAAASAPRERRLSELFEPDLDTLFVYSFMYVDDEDGNPLARACPDCTSIIDAVAGEARHITQRLNFAVASKAPIEVFQQHAESRGWPDVRLLSSADSSYNRDYLAETEDGSQRPMATVFVRDDEGVRHFWSSELLFVENIQGFPRHVDFIWPLWSVLDCTPDGRGEDWGPALSYPEP